MVDVVAPEWIEREFRFGDLKPFERNPRFLTKDAYDRLVKSLKEDGYHSRIKITHDGLIVGGHARLRCLREIGYTDDSTIKVLVPSRPLDIHEFRRILIRDNLAYGDYNYDILSADFEAEELLDLGFPKKLIYSDPTFKEEADKDAQEGDPREDALPDAPRVAKTKLGDVWTLGKHRVMCGDSTNKDNVDALLAGATIDCILTDPPYCSGGFQEAGKSSGSIGTRSDDQIANDRLSTRGYMALMKSVLGCVSAPMLYAFTDWRMWINLFDVAESSGFGARSMIVWNKGSAGMGRGWRAQHEIIFCGAKQAIPFDPAKSKGNVITCKRQPNELHPTQKPVELMETLIDTTDFAQTFYEPFGGSGTTLIACEKMGKNCLAMELSPAFVDVVVKRWQEYTGKKAHHATTGELFDGVEANTPVEPETLPSVEKTA